MKQFYILLVSIFVSIITFAQNQQANYFANQFYFSESQQQAFVFDAYRFPEWQSKYNQFSEKENISLYPFYKLVNQYQGDVVLFKSKKRFNIRKLDLILNETDTLNQLKFSFSDSILEIILPPKKEDYTLKAFYRGRLVAQLNVDVLPKIKENITIVPLGEFKLSREEIEVALNKIYSKVNYDFNVKIDPVFKIKVFDQTTLLSTPMFNHLQYTGQMRLLRDLYFKNNPNRDKNSNIIFVINGFKDDLLSSYMVNYKSVGFIKDSLSRDDFTRELARTLGHGIGALNETWVNNGPEKGSTNNVMDSTLETQFTFFQWRQLHRLTNYYSPYDNEENVKTNNGTVAYYFWKEDSSGNLIVKGSNPINSIYRPYKFNFLSYRFKVKYLILRPFFKIGDYYVSILDGVLLTISILILWFARRKLKQFWIAKKFRFHFIRRFIFFCVICFVSFQVYENYWVTNRLLFYFKHIGGELEELKGMKYSKAKKELLSNQKLLHEEIPEVCSEVLILRKGKWDIKKRGKVLYFDVFHDGDKQKVVFASSEDSIKLSTLGIEKKSYRHYVVFNYRDQDNDILKQTIYTQGGLDITSKFFKEDKPKRILLFVNGYRPTSIGQTFEENFNDIKLNGIEYPNSTNFIYDFDRFDYWRPWKEINLLFQKRINPSNAYYADGHFSVRTSNYRSLLNFSSISSLYPKRCKDSLHHTCYKIQDATLEQFLFNQSKTINQLKIRPNKRGFNYRKYKGRIAGKNLLQILNETPGLSINDTLYIVAHSMGFAYSQGIIEELRGKINFGGYYVIAPENAKSGRINMEEWKQAWQYGSNFDQKYPDAPCLQDGIAPQYSVEGLPDSNRIFIPTKYYNRKGYFDAHFIGYYTWIFDIKKGEKGYVFSR
jgi:hypothetical protein